MTLPEPLRGSLGQPRAEQAQSSLVSLPASRSANNAGLRQLRN
jgi:hypothetical protein